MIQVKTEIDLNALKESNVLPRSYFEAIESLFNELREASPADELGVPFELDSGHIVILEREDDSSIILDSWPEYAELFNLDGIQIFKIVVMEDNDYIMLYFTEAGLNPEIDEWVEPYLEQ